MMGIYQIVNVKNGKKYIGSSNNITIRWEQHLNNLKYNTHHSYKLQEEWNKSSINDFHFSILEIVKDKKNLLIREQEHLDGLDIENSYNIVDSSSYKTMSAPQELINNMNYVKEMDDQTKSLLVKNLNVFIKDGSIKKIGNGKYDFSKTWFIKNTSEIKTLSNCISNYFKNKAKTCSKELAWTTFISYYGKVNGRGYTKSFIPMNGSIINDKRNNLCFAANCFFNGFTKRQFDLNIDDNTYALSILLKWIVNVSDINKQINVYLPAKRMEDLLNDWINKNKIT
ncbi:GIY-YIG nuclease family protein [Priestia megaterium]|uniref:GIY-YIG nuclease family protein n=1 Tax=Priestia megaterium TaxID=1404 RepID=UPI0011267566|nr:GIY-YIG nuclease family protein [Priestia megaterium]TPF17966.1 hypothetical protein CBE78_01710 [Priestia megaterium]TPF22074.1 hypothetical protein CBE79_04215 [Priestia megaterium]